jgi:hypothetical protein
MPYWFSFATDNSTHHNMRKEKDQEHNTTVHNTTQGKNRPGKREENRHDRTRIKTCQIKNNCQDKIATNMKNRTRYTKSSLF